MKGALVLLVEDNTDNRALMSYLLGTFGHETVEARTGEEALEMATERRPDLVICDIGLPGMDGYEVLARFKADGLAKVPIIAVTAYAMVGDRERALRAGFDGYISKPITPESFVEQLEHFLMMGQRGPDAPSRELDTGDRPHGGNGNGTHPRR
jgi:two-component system cell cycle response regulator